MPRDTKRSTLISAAASTLLLGAAAAQAAIDFRYATDLDAITLMPGETASVSLYLVETTTAGTESRLVAESGLSSASVGVYYVPPSTPLASPATVRAIAANSVEFNDPAGAQELVSPDYASATLREFVDIFDPSGPTGTPGSIPGVRTVFLGTATIQAGNSEGVTTFSIADIPVTNDTVTIDNFASPLDPLILPATLSVTVLVPEPASAAALGLFVLTGAVRPRRPARRR